MWTDLDRNVCFTKNLMWKITVHLDYLANYFIMMCALIIKNDCETLQYYNSSKILFIFDRILQHHLFNSRVWWGQGKRFVQSAVIMAFIGYNYNWLYWQLACIFRHGTVLRLIRPTFNAKILNSSENVVDISQNILHGTSLIISASFCFSREVSFF